VLHVLVVDDDPLVRDLLAAVLGDDAFDVRFAVDGKAALAAAAERAPDLVVLDVMMPGMDGYEVCRRLRETYPEMRILMLTARATDDAEEAAMAAGADAFLTKPFSPLALREFIDESAL
jgi:two-component system, OmpR family, response regulator ResD